MMRKLKIVTTLAAGACVALASTGIAGDKSQSTMVDPTMLTGASVPALTPPLAGVWTNGVSKGKSKGDSNCKVQVQLKKIAVPDSDQTPGTGDEVICVADNNVMVIGIGPLSVSAVLRGEIKSGSVKIKADLFKAATGCIPAKKGGSGVMQYDGRVTCYMPDPAYPPPPVPFAGSTPDPTQGVYPAGFAPRPATPLIATEGIYFAP